MIEETDKLKGMIRSSQVSSPKSTWLKITSL
jgi:hypothetical protein